MYAAVECGMLRPLSLCMVLITGSHCKDSVLRRLFSAKVVTAFGRSVLQTVMCVLYKWTGQKADSVGLFIKSAALSSLIGFPYGQMEWKKDHSAVPCHTSLIC